MGARHLFVLISIIAVATALYSPVRLPVFLLLPTILPDVLWRNLPIGIFFNTLVIAGGVVALSGVPAALFERVFRRPPDDLATMGVWCTTAAVLAIASWQVG